MLPSYPLHPPPLHFLAFKIVPIRLKPGYYSGGEEGGSYIDNTIIEILFSIMVMLMQSGALLLGLAKSVSYLCTETWKNLRRNVSSIVNLCPSLISMEKMQSKSKNDKFYWQVLVIDKHNAKEFLKYKITHTRWYNSSSEGYVDRYKLKRLKANITHVSVMARDPRCR